MEEYSIYKLVCNDLDVKYTYVGSTKNFTRRKYEHKNICNNQSQKNYNLKVYTTIRENGGWDNWKMIEIEKFECAGRREAEARERYWYEELNAELNSINPCISDEEKKEQKKEWYENNKEKIAEQKKEYRENNKEKIAEYRENNKQQIAEQKKEYRENNKEKINLKIKCECGGKYTYTNKSLHFKTIKHQEWLNHQSV